MIALILLVHWIADFVLQKREWANNKSKSVIALSKHCVVYSLCLTPFIFPFGVMYWMINSFGHFAIDFCYKIIFHLKKIIPCFLVISYKKMFFVCLCGRLIGII